PPGTIITGVVRNLTNYGAFIEIEEGIDGLLHVSDMSYVRKVSNPSEVVQKGQKITCQVLTVDQERKRVALGLKQMGSDPWETDIPARFTPGQKTRGKVTKLTNFGVFVELEPGLEGLLHISEMSWIKRIADPKEIVQIGDKVEVQVLNINHDKKEISLGMKQCQSNPWGEVAKKYPTGTIISGVVRNLTNYGAFIEIEEGIDGLLHVSDMSWTRKVSNPSEVVQKGQKLTCQVLSVDQERKRVALGLKQMASDPWEGDIPGRYQPGQKVRGKVTKLTNFGVFVELEPGLEGLLHISELTDDKIESPEEVVKVGDEVDVKVLRVDTKDRKVGLSMKNVDDPTVPPPDQIPDMPDDAEELPSSKKDKKDLRGGTGIAGPLFALPGEEEK
ncbi:MAG TPA: S1 RNA-binding domain-containing protein, partial [Gemmataceae bacterium]